MLPGFMVQQNQSNHLSSMLIPVHMIWMFVSTASKLPMTDEDIDGMLSFIFVGPGVFHVDCLKNRFRIRKRKVWNFLKWLKVHNHLYFDLDFDPQIKTDIVKSLAL
jgi:hypothetical protein